MTLTLTFDLINEKGSREHGPYTKSAGNTKHGVQVISRDGGVSRTIRTLTFALDRISQWGYLSLYCDPSLVQNVSMPSKVDENIVLVSNSLDLHKTSSYSQLQLSLAG